LCSSKRSKPAQKGGGTEKNINKRFSIPGIKSSVFDTSQHYIEKKVEKTPKKYVFHTDEVLKPKQTTFLVLHTSQLKIDKNCF